MKAIRLSRRAVLRGAGGAVVGLPVLDCMLDGRGEAYADGAKLPRRYAILLAGMPLGGDHWPETKSMVDGQARPETNQFITPADAGANYTVTVPLQPLADKGLKGDVNVVTGMRIPFNASSTDGSAVPPGGAYRDFHGGGASPLLSGMRSTTPNFSAAGPSSDQLVAKLPDNAGKASLVLRAQASYYLAGSSFSGRQYMSYAAAGKPIEGQTNPVTVYNSLFSGLPASSGTTQSPANGQDFERRAELGVLSLVSGRRQALLGRVGYADKTRLSDHFDRIRDLEKRLMTMITPADAASLACRRPADPGAASDWPVGGDSASTGGDMLQTNTGYSNEDKRAQLMADFLHIAFACDLTRVATLMITAFQSHMNAYPIASAMGMPVRADLHEIGHNGDTRNQGQAPMSLMLKWHVGIYARLLDNMKKTVEGAGTLLDNSAIIFMPEAGHGRQLNDGKSPDATHCVENMILLVGGRAGGMKPGRHIPMGNNSHPGQTLLAAMKAVGYPGDTMGEVSGANNALFTA